MCSACYSTTGKVAWLSGKRADASEQRVLDAVRAMAVNWA